MKSYNQQRAERLMFAIVKHLVFWAVLLTVLWVIGLLALHRLERVTWSPDKLDGVRIAAGVYLIDCISRGWGSVVKGLLPLYKWWTE